MDEADIDDLLFRGNIIQPPEDNFFFFMHTYVLLLLYYTTSNRNFGSFFLINLIETF